MLDSALQEAGIGSVRRVKWLRSLDPSPYTPVGSGILADYDGVEGLPGQSHPHEPGAVAITVYSVPGSQGVEAEAVLGGEGLHALVSWLAVIPSVRRPQPPSGPSSSEPSSSNGLDSRRRPHFGDNESGHGRWTLHPRDPAAQPLGG